MASELGSDSSPPPTKRPKTSDFGGLGEVFPGQTTSGEFPENPGPPNPGKGDGGRHSPQRSWFLPSSEASAMSSDEPEGIDSGFSDGATPPASCDDSQDANPGPFIDRTAPPASADDEEDDDDQLSVLSGLSGLSGSNWKPTAGPYSWVQRQMAGGVDPRSLLREMLSTETVIPDHLDQLTLWKIILNVVSEPPSRKKLASVNTIDDVVGLIRSSKKIIVLTGAGVSVSCGIPDFRSRDGVYARLAVDFPDLPDPQAMFDIHYFRKDPRPFFKFAREIYPGQFRPSPCHRFIRCLEKHSKLLRNYTQNIDTLEQVVGLQNVIQCHGSFATATCTVCKRKVEAAEIRDNILAQKIPYCTVCSANSISSRVASVADVQHVNDVTHVQDVTDVQHVTDVQDVASVQDVTAVQDATDVQDVASEPGPSVSSSVPDVSTAVQHGIMKPDIVFFGEGLGDHFHNAVATDKDQVDLLIMIGSSLKVRPVALIPSSIDPSIPQILINREPLPHLTPDVELLGDCDEIVNQLCHMLGEGWEDGLHQDPLKESTELEPIVEADRSNLDPQASLWEAKSVPRQSIAQRVKSGHYFFSPPFRYVFPGAEVFEPRQGDDEGSSSASSSDDGNDSDDEESDANPRRDDGENRPAAAAENRPQDSSRTD